MVRGTARIAGATIAPCGARTKTPPPHPGPLLPGGEERGRGIAICVPPPPFGGRGTGGGGLVFRATLPHVRDHVSRPKPIHPTRSRLIPPQSRLRRYCAVLLASRPRRRRGGQAAREAAVRRIRDAGRHALRALRPSATVASPMRPRRAVRSPERRNGRSPSANGRGAVEVRERSLQSETRLKHAGRGEGERPAGLTARDVWQQVSRLQLALGPAGHSLCVMAGLVPAIHEFFVRQGQRTWMPGTIPGMTK